MPLLDFHGSLLKQEITIVDLEHCLDRAALRPVAKVLTNPTKVSANPVVAGLLGYLLSTDSSKLARPHL